MDSDLSMKGLIIYTWGICPYHAEYNKEARIWLANHNMGLRTDKGDYFGKNLLELEDN